MNLADDPLGTSIVTEVTAAASSALDLRIADFRRTNRPVQLDGVTKIIQFLRGTWSRASYVLPAYYTYLGALATETGPLAGPEGTRVAYAKFSSLATISLACRAIFDHRNDGLRGKTFANASAPILSSVAAHWSRSSGSEVSHAAGALNLLREIFKLCARPSRELLNGTSLLERRVGLVKCHADSEGAHISLDSYLFDISDLIHVVAAITVTGSIIATFDAKDLGIKYFDSVDDAAWRTARETYPKIPSRRLFEHFAIHEQARLYWMHEDAGGLDMILNGLPAAIGFWG